MTEERTIRPDNFKIETVVGEVDNLRADRTTLFDTLPDDTPVTIQMDRDWDFGTVVEATVEVEDVEADDG